MQQDATEPGCTSGCQGEYLCHRMPLGDPEGSNPLIHMHVVINTHSIELYKSRFAPTSTLDPASRLGVNIRCRSRMLCKAQPRAHAGPMAVVATPRNRY